MSESVKMSLRQITPELRAAIRSEALEADHTMADTVVLALAEYFGEDIALSGRTYKPLVEYSQYLEIHVPASIHFALWREGQRTRFTANSCALSILAQRYGIDYEPVKRGPKATKARGN